MDKNLIAEKDGVSLSISILLLLIVITFFTFTYLRASVERLSHKDLDAQ